MQERGWPENELEVVASCPCCGSARRSLLHEALADVTFAAAPGRWQLHRCLGCGSAYLDPRPTVASIGRAYGSYYTHDGAGRPDSAELSARGRWLRALANGYRNHRYGVDFQPASRAGALLRFLPTLRYRIESAYRDLLPPDGAGSLLDVGCGSGAFLLNAQSLGWRVKGVDADETAVAQAQGSGLDVALGGIEALGADERFDVITLSHVLEHVHDPEQLLRACREHLTTSGELHVDTPNIDSFGHRWFGSSWRGLEAPRHLVLFNASALRDLLRRAGFPSVAFRAPRPVALSVLQQSMAARTGLVPAAGRVPPTFNGRLAARVMAGAARALVRFRPERAEFLSLVARAASE